jgi:hypothetical protein
MTDQVLPGKPDWLAEDEHNYILERDRRQCVFHGRCPRAGAAAYCDEALEFDHAQPRALGGDDTFGNVRLLCASYNRSRPLEPMQKWAQRNYFDGAVRPGALRNIQRIAGWDAIEAIEPAIVERQDLRRTLLAGTSYLPGATGTGKLILAISVLFKLNQIIGEGRPRARNVLWLTNDTVLRDAGAQELENDAFAHGFASRQATVQAARGYRDIAAGPNGADIKIAAAQSLWRVEDAGKDAGLRRAADEIRRALQAYDTVVFDECDFGNKQVRWIASLATNALRLSLSASPPLTDIDGDKKKAQEFLKRFVLIAPDAIADYVRARDLDNCLKFIDPAEVQVAAAHDAHQVRSVGEIEGRQEKLSRDHVLHLSAIIETVVEMDRLESEMKEAEPERWFSPHGVVHMRSVAEVVQMCAGLNKALEDLDRIGKLKNKGWRAAMVFEGADKPKFDLPPEERDLFGRRAGRLIHPFLLALGNSGQASEKSKRLLVQCQIGSRGINNWPISFTVDCTGDEAPATLIQLVWGRPMRWPRHLAGWINPANRNARFATVRVRIPQGEQQADKIAAVRQAADFIMNMAAIIGEAGFLTWRDLLEGKRPDSANVVIDPSNRPLTQTEKYAVQRALAEATEANGGRCHEGLVIPAIDRLPAMSDKAREKMMTTA